MTADPPRTTEKTILDRKKWYSRKIGAVMTAVALATSMAALEGCGPNTGSQNDQDSSSWTDSTTDTNAQTTVPEDIANLDNAAKAGTLVQGRQACIDKLVTNGLTGDEAGKVCDSISAEAKAQIQAQQAQQPATAAQPQTVVVNNSSNDALLWYWIGYNSRSPYVYYGSPSSGLSLYHTSYNSNLKSAPPPARLNPIQTTYLSTETHMRPAVMSQLAARPGIKVVSVSHFTTDGTHFVLHGSNAAKTSSGTGSAAKAAPAAKAGTVSAKAATSSVSHGGLSTGHSSAGGG